MSCSIFAHNSVHTNPRRIRLTPMQSASKNSEYELFSRADGLRLTAEPPAGAFLPELFCKGNPKAGAQFVSFRFFDQAQTLGLKIFNFFNSIKFSIIKEDLFFFCEKVTGRSETFGWFEGEINISKGTLCVSEN